MAPRATTPNLRRVFSVIRNSFSLKKNTAITKLITLHKGKPQILPCIPQYIIIQTLGGLREVQTITCARLYIFYLFIYNLYLSIQKIIFFMEKVNKFIKENHISMHYPNLVVDFLSTQH